MTDKLQAANDLQRFLNMFQGLDAIVDSLLDVGSLEQARDEAQTQLDQLNALIKKNNEAYAIDAAKHDQEIERKKQHAEAHLAKEKELAEQVTANAKEAAGKMLAEAHAEAKEIVAEAKAVAQQHQAMTFEHRAVVDALKVEHADIKRDIEDAKREHSKVTSMIGELRAKLGWHMPEDKPARVDMSPGGSVMPLPHKG